MIRIVWGTRQMGKTWYAVKRCIHNELGNQEKVNQFIQKFTRPDKPIEATLFEQEDHCGIWMNTAENEHALDIVDVCENIHKHLLKMIAEHVPGYHGWFQTEIIIENDQGKRTGGYGVCTGL